MSERMASGLLGALRSTTDELEQSLDLGDALERIEDLLTIELGRDVPLALEGRDDQIIRAVMERMARSYTMASERMVHEAFLLPGMARLIADKPISSASPGGSADDDDALFDDALF
ncbi:MAG: hypothetical protein IBJ05_09060 [Blastomonas sp.]|nr:hypothetical protein [Blastomonas sp.]